MGRRLKVLSLPAEVRAELDQRLKSNNFSDFYGLADWLESLGHPVGHSAIHAYSMVERARLTGEAQGIQAVSSEVLASQLIECMRVVATARPGSSIAEMKAAAQDLLRWAYAEGLNR